MSKILLAAGLDLLRDAEKVEMETERLYQAMIKSGDSKKRDFEPVREGLRAAYEKWIKGAEVVNYMRRAAVEADRLTKLKKKLAKLEGDETKKKNKVKKASEGAGDAGEDDDDQANDDDDDASDLIGNAAAANLARNKKRGLASVSDDIVRGGVPHEVLALCEEKIQMAFQHCERIREREHNLLLSAKATDPAGKLDCSRSRPGFVVAKILAYRAPAELLQGNFTVTIPVSDGSYQVIVRNVTDHVVAAPDVSVMVTAKWGAETKTYKAPCPPGCAFVRSIGIVGGSDASSIFVNVNSSGLRTSAVEVIVRMLVPAAVAAMVEKQQKEEASVSASAAEMDPSLPSASGEQQQQLKLSLQPGTGYLQSLLPALIPIGGNGGEPQHQQHQQQQPVGKDALEPPGPRAQQQQEGETEKGSGAAAAAAAAASSSNALASDSAAPTEAPCPFPLTIAEMTPQQLKERILQLVSIVDSFPHDVAVPMDVDATNNMNDEDDDDDTSAGADQRRKERRQKEDEKLAAASRIRTADERALEDFVSELPPPTAIMGLDDFDDVIGEMGTDMQCNLDDLKAMEDAMMGF